MSVRYVAQKVNAGNDVNGNPRRGWILYEVTGGSLPIENRGYAPFAAFIREQGSGRLDDESGLSAATVVELGRTINITGGEWQALKRVARGSSRPLHRNPTLAILNPPIQRHRTDIQSNRHGALMSNRVYEIRYRHVEDAKDYKHAFGPHVEMFALGDGTILLKHRHGEPLSEDF